MRLPLARSIPSAAEADSPSRTESTPVDVDGVRRHTPGRRASHHAGGVARAFVFVVAVAWILFATVAIVLRYAVLPHVGDYRQQIEGLASRALGETVRIGAIEASWRGLRPSLQLRALQVVDARGDSVLELPSVRATLSWDTLLVLQPRLASLEIDAPRLLVRRDVDGRLFVAGFPVPVNASHDHKAGEWLLAQHEVRVRNARIVWHDEMRASGADAVMRDDLVLTDVGVALSRSGWRHRIAVHASPPASLAAPLDVRAVIDHSLFTRRLADVDDWRGTVYADIGSGDVTAWRPWLPLPPTLDAGKGRARFWVQFTGAADPAGSFVRRLVERTGRPLPAALDRIKDVTADLALDDLSFHWGTSVYTALASIDGRVDASQSPTEQRFSARHMALQPRDGNTVPPTDFDARRTIGRSVDDEVGTASIGAIDIGVSLGLVPDALVPPAIVEKYVALKPRGIVDRMSVRWTGSIVAPATFQVDAAFKRLALAAQPPTAEAIQAASIDIVGPGGVVRKPHPAFGRPGFDHVDGTLSATRDASTAPGGLATTRVTMHVDGNDTSVTAPGLFDEPTLRIAHLAAQIGVTVHGPDVEVKVDHASLDNADLAGAVDLTFRHGPAAGGGRGWIDLDARLSRAEVARVPRYLPTLIGPKARAYLSKSLLGGKVSAASFRMRGALEQLSLRALPGALATPNPVALTAALVAVRDAGTARPPQLEASPGASSDDAIFHAVVKVKGGTFLYGPARDAADAAATANATGQPSLPSVAWPAFEDLDADIVFDQARMTVFGNSTRVYGYRLTDVRAELPALADPAHVLRVVGKGSGPLQDLVRFINDSPVSRWTRQFTATTRAAGDARFALALDLPLTHARDAEVAGSLQFADNELALNAVLPPLARLNGRLDFTDRGMTIDAMTGSALGGPLRIDAVTRPDGFIELNADGTVDVAGLKTSLQQRDAAAEGPRDAMRDGPRDAAEPARTASVVDRAARWLSGSARYNVALRLRNKRAAEAATATPSAPKPDIVVTSDLVGLGISLPAPFTKPAADSRPLRIAINRTANTAGVGDAEDIRVSLADIVDVDVRRQRDAQGRFAVTGANYRIGDERAPGGGPSSIRIGLPMLDLDAWRDVIRQVAATPRPGEPVAATKDADPLLPVHATLTTPLLRAAGRDFTDVSIDARRLPSGWQADIAADQVAGRLSYTDVSGTTSTRNGVAPASSGRLVARLTRLVLPKSDTAVAHVDETIDTGHQRDFPAIDLVVDRFELRGRSLGRLEVQAHNVGEGARREWQLEKLGLSMPEARFAAHGSWGRGDGVENTRLDFELDASNVGALMDRFGLTKTIKNGTARMNGSVSWDGGPTTIDFASMHGKLGLAADKGQFLKADPGIAKLLNILSLQGLARRLTLDFNDVFDEGFAFDTVRADMKVDKGIATTDDFKMKGVQATVSMSGSADLARETTDLHVVVAPDINAGAASLGVAVVNPVLGLATFAAQYLFKDRISKALSFEYNVVGPWSKPEVTKIDRNGRATIVPRKPAALPTPSPAALPPGSREAATAPPRIE